MQVKGRYLVIAWTTVFLAAVGAIVYRARAGFVIQANVGGVNAHIRSLEGVRGDVEAKIAELESRPELGPKVEAFGLRFASDTEFRLLPVHGGH